MSKICCEMAHVLQVFVIILSFVLLKCEDIIDDGKTDEPYDDGNNLLNGIGEMSDDQLWNLLKEASRTNSSSVDNTVYDYGDYVELEESEPKVTTESIDITSVDEFSTIDSSSNLSGEDVSSTTIETAYSPTAILTYSSSTDIDFSSPSSIIYPDEASSPSEFTIVSTTESEVASSSSEFPVVTTTESEVVSTSSEYIVQSTTEPEVVSSSSEYTTASTIESEVASSSSEFPVESTTESEVVSTSSEYIVQSTTEAEVVSSSSEYTTASTIESDEASSPSEFTIVSTTESEVVSTSTEHTVQSTAEPEAVSTSSKYTVQSTTEPEVASSSTEFAIESTTEPAVVSSPQKYTIETTTASEAVSSSSEYTAESTTSTTESGVVSSSSGEYTTRSTTISKIASPSTEDTIESTTMSEAFSAASKHLTISTTVGSADDNLTEIPGLSTEPSTKLEPNRTPTITTISLVGDKIRTTIVETSNIPSSITSSSIGSTTSKIISEATTDNGVITVSTNIIRSTSTESTSTKANTTEKRDIEVTSPLLPSSYSTTETSTTISTVKISKPSQDNSTQITNTSTTIHVTLPQAASSVTKSPIKTTKAIDENTTELHEKGKISISTTGITEKTTITTLMTSSATTTKPVLVSVTKPTLISQTSTSPIAMTQPIDKKKEVVKQATSKQVEATTIMKQSPSTTTKSSTKATTTKAQEQKSTTPVTEPVKDAKRIASSVRSTTTIKPKSSVISQKSTSPTTTSKAKDKMKEVVKHTTSKPPEVTTVKKQSPSTTTKTQTKATTPKAQKKKSTTPVPEPVSDTKRIASSIRTTTTEPETPMPTRTTNTPTTAKTTKASKRKSTSKKKTTPIAKPTTSPKPITTVTKPTTSTTATTFLPIRNVTARPATARPKLNKFDPKKISIIDEYTDKPPVSVTTKGSCESKQCSPPKKSKVNIFDSSKIFMIDQMTEPPVVFKKPFDPSRKFAVVDELPEKSERPKDIKKIHPAPKSHLQPVLKPSIFIQSPEHSVKTENTGSDGEITYDQKQINTNKVPEVLCFTISNDDGKNFLKCFTVNSGTKTFSAPFFINLRPSNQFPTTRQSVPPIRRIFIRDRNYHGPAMVMSPRPVFHRPSHHITGNIFHSGREGRFRLSLKTPTNHLHLANNPPQEIIEQSVIGLGKQIKFQMVPPQPLPGCCNQQNQDISSGSDQLNYRILIRRPRSTATTGCNADNTIYEDEGRTLAFVFDNTGSMHNELEQMRKTAMEITTQMTGSKRNLIKDYTLVTFNDPGVSEPFCTTDYTDFLGKLQKISIRGGGDCPEMCLTGLQKALTVSRPGSFIFVITDAYAKDYYLEEKILNLVMRKTPSIFYLITGSCTDYPPEGFEVFRNISTASNGQIIDMGKMGVKQILDELNDKYVRKNLVTLTKFSSNKAAPSPYAVNVPVDPSVHEITMSVTGKNAQLDVTNPKGDKPPGESKQFTNLKIYHYKEPIPGVWVARIGSSSAHSFSTVGVSSTNFKVGFSVLPAKKVSETSHRPLKGGENYIFVEVSNPEGVEDIKYIELVDLSGKSVNKVYLKKIPTKNNETIYSGGPFIPPDALFNMEMNGIGKDGEPIKRISPSAIVPQLPEPPYITMLSRIEVNAGQSVVLKCHVESLVPVNVKMYKKTSSSQVMNYNFKQSGDGLFELKNISPSDEGTYVCWANNLAGDQQKAIDVTVNVKPPTVAVKEEVLFTPDQHVVIPCSVNSSVPYTVHWKRGGDGDFYYVHNNSNTYVTDNGLVIEKAQETDKGWYQCIAKNVGGESEGVTYLKLSLVPVIEISATQKYLADFNISLTCSAYGVPAPEVVWHRNGIQLSTQNRGRIRIKYFPKYGEIRINDAQQEDEGTYTCVAKNFAGEVTKETFLIYQEKPKIVTNVVQNQIKAGEDISLECHVTGLPTPRIEWTKDSLPVSPESLPNTKVLSDNSLLIRPSSLVHTGIYKCLAQNEFGFDEVTIPIQVIGIKPQIIESPKDIAIEIGENGRLTCKATGHPDPKISWIRTSGKSISGEQDENSLEIYNASLSEKGEYWCIAVNTMGRAEARAFVNITGGVLPVISKEKYIEIIKVLVGEKAKLDCAVIGGNPQPEIEWFKDGVKLLRHSSSGIKLENGSYFISTVNPSDVGLYECIASNPLGTDDKKIELKLYEPPKIDMNSSSNVIATIGTNARLTCIVTGDPNPMVTWKRHAHSYHKSIRGKVFDDSNDLVFENVSEEDSGRYICTAENIAGTARRPFALHVMVPPKIVPWPVEMFVESGNILTLECRVRAIPRPSIFWLKNNETIPKSKYYGQFLRFYTKPEDSGRYTCIAENRAGKDKVETNLIVLVPPQIQAGPSTIKVISGNNAVLPCEVSGNPKPSVAWQSNGELIKKEFGSDSGTLYLHNVTEADAGTYICTAQNKAGINKKKLELLVLTPPKVLPWTEPIKVILGELVNITCQHFANPEATINWYKDKQPLSSMKDKNRIEFVVELHHKGVYTCEAVNEAGSDSKDFLLVILDPPSFAQELPFSIDVIRGKTVEIPCIAFGDPKPTMGWNRTDIILESNNRRIINTDSGLLTIINASPEDEGYYNCTAKNRAGYIWRTIELNVLELPVANLTVSSNIVKEGDVAEFTCNVKGKPKPNIYWKKDGKILSTENDKNLRLIAYYKDQGNYTCVVKNSAGEDFSSVELNVSVLPSIDGPKEERLVVLEGEEVLLKCFGGGMPLPKITWVFNGTHQENNLFGEIVDAPELKIEKAARNHDGIYICTRTNFAGSVEKQFRVFVYVKPTIIDHFDSQITLLEGKDFSLPCNAEGIPKPTITWMKENMKLNSQNTLASLPSVHDNILLIFNAKNSSGGNYTCNATNDAGVAMKIYTVNVEALKQQTVEGIRMIEIKEGEDGELNCEAKEGSTISWLKDKQTLDKMPLERADDVHYAVNDGGSRLKITEASPSDSGLYTCVIKHPEEEEVTRLFSISVLVAPYFLDLFPTTEFTVRENDSLSLECPAQGTPTPVINWRLAESNLPINEHTLPGVNIHGTNEDALVISSAKPFHTGLYLCSAVNKLGEERRIFNIKVIGSPRRHGPELRELDIVSGTPLELNCSIDASPDPVYKWSFISRTGEDKVLKYISKTIRIGNAQAEDDGIYKCSASNLFGNSSKVFNVSVIDIPRIKRGLDETVRFAEGEDCSLQCICTGRKPVEVKWFYNGTQLNSSECMTMNIYNSSQIEYTFTIPNVSKVSEGTYSCVLSNIAGSDERHFQVEVIAPPKFSTTPKNEEIHLMEGAAIHLECPMESRDDFKIQWKKNGILIPEIENSTFHVNVSTIKDEGNYTCIASNFAGWLASKFEVNVFAEPKMLSSTNDTYQKIPLDKKLILNCTVRGNPRPKILWTKNLEQINDVLLPQIIFSEDDQILEIDEVDTSDAGRYSCFPSNTVGSVEKHFEVEIIVPPLIKEKEAVQEKIMMVDVFRRAVLRCPFTGSPEPKITWYKDDKEINESEQRFRISPDRKLLTINHAEESVTGAYKCSGKNEVGDNTLIFHLHIKIPMQWSQWTEWQECNVSCGGGVQIRKRECMGERNEILSEYIHFYNSSCLGPGLETQECNAHICPIDGGWGYWAEWGPCSSSCGQGWRRRSRRCNNPLPSHGGADCSGETYEDEKCEGVPCPVNGNWGEWSDWNDCSATCGPSIKMRTRRCNNPAPAYGGLPCSGNSRDIALCKNKDCPSDVGGWSSWSRWSQCTVSCGTGKQVRTRTCFARYGTECKGEKYQVKICKKAPCNSRRYPRHANLNIHGKLNDQQIDENIQAEIIQSSNETLIEAVSKNISNKDAYSYLPFIMSPVSWYTAKEFERGKNGLSLTNGSFQENSTYKFSTGEQMEVQSDAQSINNDEDLKLDIKVQGSAPVSSAATIIINPYTEEIIQTDSKHIKSSSATNLDAEGNVIPVSWTKSVSFSGREGSRIFPVEALTTRGSKSHFDRERNQLEFQANPTVVSSKFFRDLCPTGFKFDSETGECSDINECRRKTLNDCLPSQICINNLGSYTCECRQGFRKNPNNVGCKDINECLEGLHQCSHKCQNTRGSYQCLCPRHLILAEDMHNCVEDYDDYYSDSIDYMVGSSSTILKSQISSPFRKGKSLLPPMDLEPEQMDETDEGNHFSEFKEKKVICEDGFRRIGNECEDINECTENENSCTREQLCMDTPGSFVCIEAPCPEHFILSAETRSCLLLCLEEEAACTDGALLSESLQIITVPVYKGNYTFHPFTNILEMASYDNNDLPLSGSIYEVVQNEAGLPVKIRNENRMGVLYAVKYFEVNKSEKLILMSAKYDSNGNKLHSTMFVVIIYNIKSSPM